ncbi:iron complex transport system permease protein [Lishizhenia tianjinensis]|uniref:Iron complex transport system permease protein n=1 Tax=Lishizhenia tianjinensis TaxID=477690 RepID=A0A1I6XLK8_9FLAO|nr:iron ABC transporter permease [Lishizhenia tianjinensis]SFT39205.1 iron complex transport system permease protein [Lishizhenia tianjinensis]
MTKAVWIFILGCGVLLSVMLAAVKLGAVEVNTNEILQALSKLGTQESLTTNEAIFMNIRLPRVLLTAVVGAILALGGVLLQALFLNPIVEPGLVGTSSGAAFGAALYFTLGVNLPLGEFGLPFMAFLGGVLSTALVFLLSQNKKGKLAIVALLLSGLAINALFLSGVGFLSYLARDPQARSITFWNLGTTSGANWDNLKVVSVAFVICLVISLRYAKSLNALILGEDEAVYLGVNVKRLKFVILFLNVLMIAVATAFTGVISFVGLVVPHLVRMFLGSENKRLMWISTLVGAVLLCLSDLLSRTLFAPAELPIGILTTLIGVPVFIYLLRKNNYQF